MKTEHEEKRELSESLYMCGHGLDWEDSDDISEQLYAEGYRKVNDNVVRLPCNVGDLVHFKGLDTPWKVSAIHFYAEGSPQISLTSESGKVTTTMTFDEFGEYAIILKDREV